jgi:hypothetical protein
MARRHDTEARCRASPITTAQYSHTPALLLVPACHPHSQRGFPRATQGEVPDTYDSTGELTPATYAPSIAGQMPTREPAITLGGKP